LNLEADTLTPALSLSEGEGAGKRVLFVNPGRALGGAEHSLLLLLQGLRARAVEVEVALFGGGPFRDRLSALGIPVLDVALPRWTRAAGRYRLPGGPVGGAALMAAGLPGALRLAAVVRRAGADLIHTNGMKAHLLGGLAGWLARVPVIWHLRDFPPAGWAGRPFHEAARRLPEIILSPSEAVAGSVRLPGRTRPRVVPDPVDLDRLHPVLPRDRIRRELGVGGEEPLIGMIAHLTPWKGHEVFLEIARAVADRIPRSRFVVAGGSIYQTHGHAGYPETLRQRAAALGLSDRVTFLGTRDDIPELLAGLDVLVHPPTAPEPFGRVLAEAMAVGRPVVAARCGGIPEVVEDGVTGFLAPSADIGAFTAAVVRLLEDPVLCRRLGGAGRRRAEARFGIEAHAVSVLEAYRAVLEGRRAAA
jgi:glycosyltransferase involved in cell wall biosynthesis